MMDEVRFAVLGPLALLGVDATRAQQLLERLSARNLVRRRRRARQHRPGPLSGGPGWFYDIDWWNGDNEISSIDNATGRAIRVWANDNPSGNSICLPPHTRRNSLGSFNDDAESFVVVQSC